MSLDIRFPFLFRALYVFLFVVDGFRIKKCNDGLQAFFLLFSYNLQEFGRLNINYPVIIVAYK